MNLKMPRAFSQFISADNELAAVVRGSGSAETASRLLMDMAAYAIVLGGDIGSGSSWNDVVSSTQCVVTFPDRAAGISCGRIKMPPSCTPLGCIAPALLNALVATASLKCPSQYLRSIRNCSHFISLCVRRGFVDAAARAVVSFAAIDSVLPSDAISATAIRASLRDLIGSIPPSFTIAILDFILSTPHITSLSITRALVECIDEAMERAGLPAVYGTALPPLNSPCAVYTAGIGTLGRLLVAVGAACVARAPIALSCRRGTACDGDCSASLPSRTVGAPEALSAGTDDVMYMTPPIPTLENGSDDVCDDDVIVLSDPAAAAGVTLAGYGHAPTSSAAASRVTKLTAAASGPRWPLDGPSLAGILSVVRSLTSPAGASSSGDSCAGGRISEYAVALAAHVAFTVTTSPPSRPVIEALIGDGIAASVAPHAAAAVAVADALLSSWQHAAPSPSDVRTNATARAASNRPTALIADGRAILAFVAAGGWLRACPPTVVALVRRALARHWAATGAAGGGGTDAPLTSDVAVSSAMAISLVGAAIDMGGSDATVLPRVDVGADVGESEGQSASMTSSSTPAGVPRDPTAHVSLANVVATSVREVLAAARRHATATGAAPIHGDEPNDDIAAACISSSLARVAAGLQVDTVVRGAGVRLWATGAVVLMPDSLQPSRHIAYISPFPPAPPNPAPQATVDVVVVGDLFSGVTARLAAAERELRFAAALAMEGGGRVAVAAAAAARIGAAKRHEVAAALHAEAVARGEVSADVPPPEAPDDPSSVPSVPETDEFPRCFATFHEWRWGGAEWDMASAAAAVDATVSVDGRAPDGVGPNDGQPSAEPSKDAPPDSATNGDLPSTADAGVALSEARAVSTSEAPPTVTAADGVRHILSVVKTGAAEGSAAATLPPAGSSVSVATVAGVTTTTTFPPSGWCVVDSSGGVAAAVTAAAAAAPPLTGGVYDDDIDDEFDPLPKHPVRSHRLAAEPRGPIMNLRDATAALSKCGEDRRAAARALRGLQRHVCAIALAPQVAIVETEACSKSEAPDADRTGDVAPTQDAPIITLSRQPQAAPDVLTRLLNVSRPHVAAAHAPITAPASGLVAVAARLAAMLVSSPHDILPPAVGAVGGDAIGVGVVLGGSVRLGVLAEVLAHAPAQAVPAVVARLRGTNVFAVQRADALRAMRAAAMLLAAGHGYDDSPPLPKDVLRDLGLLHVSSFDADTATAPSEHPPADANGKAAPDSAATRGAAGRLASFVPNPPSVHSYPPHSCMDQYLTVANPSGATGGALTAPSVTYGGVVLRESWALVTRRREAAANAPAPPIARELIPIVAITASEATAGPRTNHLVHCARLFVDELLAEPIGPPDGVAGMAGGVEEAVLLELMQTLAAIVVLTRAHAHVVVALVPRVSAFLFSLRGRRLSLSARVAVLDAAAQVAAACPSRMAGGLFEPREWREALAAIASAPSPHIELPSRAADVLELLYGRN